MTNANTETTATATAVATPAVPKAPSKKSLAQVIFNAKLAEREQGLFGSNKEFRSAVLAAIEADVGVSRASASTIYNSFKKDAEAAGTTLGRDPKKVKVASTGKRGRPVGSHNRPKEVAAEAPAESAAPVVAEATA